MGTAEIALAVTATTMSLVIIFLPVAFMEGRVGRFFHSFGLTTAAAIMVSLVISFTLTPVLSARVLRPPGPTPGAGTRRLHLQELPRLRRRGGGLRAAAGVVPAPPLDRGGAGGRRQDGVGWFLLTNSRLPSDGRLVAMTGERVKCPGFTEVSAVCTAEEVRGQGPRAAARPGRGRRDPCARGRGVPPRGDAQHAGHRALRVDGVHDAHRARGLDHPQHGGGIAMPVEFLGMGATNDGSETNRRSTAASIRSSRSRWRGHTRSTAGTASSPRTAPGARTRRRRRRGSRCTRRRLQVLLAHRPNLSIPTFAAKTFATLDHMSDGRLLVHFITGGNDHEQQREGDFLGHDERYDRTREYIQIVKQVVDDQRSRSTTRATHYRFADFVSDMFPVQQPHPPISFGGSSDAAYEVGAQMPTSTACGASRSPTRRSRSRAWTAECAAAGRPRPKIQVAFRPILGPTEEAGVGASARHRRAHRVARGAEEPVDHGGARAGRRTRGRSGCSTSPRAASGSTRRCTRRPRVRRARWATRTRSSERRRRSPTRCMDYVKLGVDILSARGYDTLQDTIDFGKHVIPLVRAEVAKLDRERESAPTP